MDEKNLRERLGQYHFYHIIPLTDTISTPGNPAHVPSQRPVMAALKGLNLRGKRVLDVGCRDGLYSFTAERQGASEVIGVDCNLSLGAVELLIPYFKSKVRMHEINILNLTPDVFGTFDVIIFAGVLYHLRHPFWALKRIRDLLRPGGTLLLETAVFHGCTRHPMLYCPVNEESPYEPSSCSFFNRKALFDTLTSLGWRIVSSSYLNASPDFVSSSPEPTIDRIVVVSELSGVVDERLDRYWHRTRGEKKGTTIPGFSSTAAG